MRCCITIFVCLIALASCKGKYDTIFPSNQVSKDVSYGTDSLYQRADIYWRNTTTNIHHPVIILIHGGGWYRGDKTNFDDLDVINIFLGYGFVVVNMNYRLAPAYKYPAPLDDIDSAIAMVRANCKLYNIDTNQIYLLGKSAGSHIALQYAYTRKNAQVKAVVDFFGIIDLTAREQLNLGLDSQIASFIGAPYATAPDNWRQSSPIFHMSDAIPTCIIQGTADDIVFPIQSKRLNDSLELYRITHKYIVWEGYNHALDVPVWQTSTDMVCKWLETYTRE